MNKIVVRSMASTYHGLVAKTDRYMVLFHKMARAECDSRGDVCTCHHADNEHWISVIGGPIACGPKICPHFKGD